MLNKYLFSLLLLGGLGSPFAVADEKGAEQPSDEAIFSVDAKDIREIRVVSDDKKTVTTYRVEQADPRVFDTIPQLLSTEGKSESEIAADRAEAFKIRTEIRANVIKEGTPLKTSPLNPSELDKLKSESQCFWGRRWGWGGGWGWGWGWGWGVSPFWGWGGGWGVCIW